jgi:hypothetical protein
LLLSVCGKRVESFPESLLRSILGVPVIPSNAKRRADRHRRVTPDQLFKGRNITPAGAAREITIA